MNIEIILLSFVFDKLNDILFKKLMPTLHAVCGGWPYIALTSLVSIFTHLQEPC